MKKILIAALLGAAAVCAHPAHAQDHFWDRLRGSNTALSSLQPAWISPLIQSDPRLTQGIRLSVSKFTAPGAQTLNYGNNHGVGFIVGTRFQLDLTPPSFFRNHSASLPDGWGNASTQMKVRIASGNADHGNFAVSAMWEHGFAPGANQNYMLTGYDVPKLAAGKVFGRFDVQSSVDGLLPTGKIAQQGRAVDWNVAAQFHASARTWFDLENNATFIYGSPFDGKTQNFITPAAFLMLKARNWTPGRPLAVIDGGIQIATSHFNFYNHNVITELRILF